MGNVVLGNIVKCTAEQYRQLKAGQTVNGHTYNPSYLYICEPEDDSFANYLPLAGGTMTGDITLSNEVSLKAKDSTNATSYSILYANSDDNIMFGNSNFGVIYSYNSIYPITNNAYNLGVSGIQWNKICGKTLYENGITLANKYLGISATAADSTKLGGVESSSYATKTYVSNVAAGLVKAYVVGPLSSSSNSYINSHKTDNTIYLKSGGTTNASTITLLDNTSLDITTLKTGDVIYFTDTDIPDRWVSVTNTGNDIALFKLETTKVELSSYATLSTSQTITGQKNFNTNTNSSPLIISRLGSTQNEYLKIGVTDNSVIFDHKQDETEASYYFYGTFTDTEANQGANAGQHYVKFALTSAEANIYVDSSRLAKASELNSYLPLSGGTLTGLLTVKTEDHHTGIKVGSTYISGISSNGRSDLIFENTTLRFGADRWDYNYWAGLKYDHSNKILYLGIADGTIFTANSAQSGGKLYLPGISSIYVGNGTTAVSLNGHTHSQYLTAHQDISGKLNTTGGTLTGTLTAQAIAPSATTSYDLGTSSAKWNNIYSSTLYSSNIKGNSGESFYITHDSYMGIKISNTTVMDFTTPSSSNESYGAMMFYAPEHHYNSINFWGNVTCYGYMYATKNVQIGTTLDFVSTASSDITCAGVSGTKGQLISKDSNGWLTWLNLTDVINNSVTSLYSTVTDVMSSTVNGTLTTTITLTSAVQDKDIIKVYFYNSTSTYHYINSTCITLNVFADGASTIAAHGYDKITDGGCTVEVYVTLTNTNKLQIKTVKTDEVSSAPVGTRAMKLLKIERIR